MSEPKPIEFIPKWARGENPMFDLDFTIGSPDPETPPMTDEELGRAWAAKQRIRPYRGDHVNVYWYPEGMPGADGHTVPEVVASLLGVSRCYPTESTAYTALGATLRRVLAFADGVKEVMGV